LIGARTLKLQETPRDTGKNPRGKRAFSEKVFLEVLCVSAVKVVGFNSELNFELEAV
jgi:hypothetical protein